MALAGFYCRPMWAEHPALHGENGKGNCGHLMSHFSYGCGSSGMGWGKGPWRYSPHEYCPIYFPQAK